MRIRKTSKTFLSIALIVALGFGAMRLYYRLTDDFRLANMACPLIFHSEWDTPPLTVKEEARLEEILSQPFRYLGKGAQSYVFESPDGNYVIKFFKFKHLRPNFITENLPSIFPFKDYKNRQISRKQRKLYGVFQGYKLAYDLDRSNAGLIFVQLNVPAMHALKMVVHDKLGLTRRIDLSQVPFVIQKKGTTLRQTMRESLNRGDVLAAKGQVDQIFALYLEEYQKGLWDHDHGVMHNMGFVAGRPCHLDVGKFHYDPAIRRPENYQPDLLQITDKIKVWVGRNYPPYAEELTQHIDTYLDALFSQKVTPL